MIWVAWRQQRAETLIAVACLALLAALFVPTGLEMASRFDSDGLAACTAAASDDGCRQAIQAFTARFGSLMNLLPWLNLLPGVIGVALAAPLLLELESGTYRLAWTQSVTRRRWLAVKLGLTMLAAVLAAVAVTALVTWWRTPHDELFGRMENVFDFEGTVGIGYVLFALGLPLAIGAVWRRTVPALIVGFAGYIGGADLRPELAARALRDAAHARPGRPASGLDRPQLAKAWVVEMDPSDRFGHALAPQLDPIGRASRPACKGSVRVADPSCRARRSLHPRRLPPGEPVLGCSRASRRRSSRGIAIALIGFAAWWIHERIELQRLSAARGSRRARRSPAAPRGCSRCRRSPGGSRARR